MKRPNSPKRQAFSNHTERLIFRLSLGFIMGLLLAVAIFKLGLPARAQTTLVAPTTTTPTAMQQALEKRPVPLDASVMVPDEVMICMSSSGERFDLLGTTQNQDKTYYLLAIYPDFSTTNPLNTDDGLIETDAATGCTGLVEIGSVKKPLSAYMPEAAAQVLETQRYQRYIAQLGGLSQFQQALRDRLNSDHGRYLLSDEQVQALQQLHVQLPNNYRRLTVDTFSNP